MEAQRVYPAILLGLRKNKTREFSPGASGSARTVLARQAKGRAKQDLYGQANVAGETQVRRLNASTE